MKKIKCVVISDDHYNGLGMVRSLGLLSQEIVLILLSEEKTFINLSKYVNECIKISHTKEMLIKTIHHFIETNIDCEIVFYPVNDFAAQVLDSIHESFPHNVICPNANGELYKYSDKLFTKTIAREVGISVPYGELLELSLNVETELNLKKYPVIIKPVKSIEGAKSHIKTANDKEELRVVINQYKSLGYKRALIEEYIGGNDSYMLEVMGSRSRTGIVEYAGIIQKHREFPIINGSTSFATIIQEHEGIDYSKLTQFLSKVGYIGLFDFEFKYLDGEAYFIECNFRNGAPSYAFTMNGYNLPGVWTENELGISLGANNSKVNNIDFMIEQNDIINMLKGHPNFYIWFKEYKKSCKVFYLSEDRKPTKAYYKQFFINAIKRIIRKP